MTAHGSDDRLSAFYDGELSAAERSEVERLIAERPELQTELNMLAGLSQQLTDLAENVPEVDLRPCVMQRIQATRPVVQSVSAHPRRRWMPLLLTICSLSLLAVAVLSLLPLSNQPHSVATIEPKTPSIEELKRAMTVAAASPRPGSVPDEGIVVHDSPSAKFVVAAESTGMSGGGLGAGVDRNAGVSDPNGTGPSEFLASLEQRRDLKPGDIVSRMVEGGDVPMIAEYTVVDVRRSAHKVEILFQEHGIVPLVPDEKSETANSAAPFAKTNSVSDMKVYLVDAESQSLNTALFACQNLTEVVALNVEPLVPQPEEETHASALASRTSTADKAAPMAIRADAPGDEGVRRKNGLPMVGKESSSGQKDLQTDEKSPAPAQKPSRNGVALNAPLNLDTNGSSDVKLRQNVNGNSLVVENGDELYTEIMQRQAQTFKNGNRANASKQAYGTEPLGSSRFAPNSPELPFGQNAAASANGMLQGDGMSYGNAAYFHGNRQRAILVLRAQSPPPPPQAERLKATHP